MVMLDWAWAFDSVKPAALCHALARFGLPPEIVETIAGIYSTRAFTIKDHSGASSERTQWAGIAQGCPLSPYLFIAMQTVLLHDVFSGLILEDEPAYVVTRDVLYADDTLLVSSHPSNVQAILSRIISE